MLFNSIAALAALAQLATASVYITSPTDSTSIKGGSDFTIAWQADVDKATPLASSFGTSYVSVYTGSSTRQFLLKRLGTVDPAKADSLTVTIPANLGPNSADYFIRIESEKAVDASDAPLEAFSARFTLTGMTGTFTSAEESANGQIGSSSSTGKVVTSVKKSSTRTSTKTSTHTKVAATGSAADKAAATASTFTTERTTIPTSAATASSVSSASLTGVVASANVTGTTAAKAAETTLPALSSAGSVKAQLAALMLAAGAMVLLA